MGMKHTCSTLVLHCIDFRFAAAIQEYLKKQNLENDCDVVAAAGATKNIAAPSTPSDRDFILRQIEISKRLHDIKNVMLINHTDCGAYGGASAFSSPEIEKIKHSQDLELAKQAILEKHPDMAVQLRLAVIDRASGDIAIEEASF